jgi:hypothetical protein
MAPSRTELIDRYAELVVRVAVNIQPGQSWRSGAWSNTWSWRVP